MLIDPEGCPILLQNIQGGYCYPEKVDKPEDEKPAKDGYNDHLPNALEVICHNQFNKPITTEGKRTNMRLIRTPTGAPLRWEEV
jgi:hypothetical protein